MKYAITCMAGIFPNARNLEEYWSNIVNARVAPVTSLEKRWGILRDQYMDAYDVKKSKIYNDYGFCLSEDESFNTPMDSGRQVIVAKAVLQELARQIPSSSQAFDFRRTGLVLGTSWTDVDYFNKDIDLLLGKPVHELKGDIYTSDKQLSAIAESIGIGGPCFSVDTACASSLYALDSGMGLLKNGLADSVIVMGLNISIPYYLHVGFSKLNALSANHQILPFSKDASGIILGEGAGAILIEPLDKAVQSGHRILAMIESLGLSADGEERSPFAPGYRGQLSALTKAYQGLSDINIDYVEAHGTATKIGDETELKALNDFFHKFQHGRSIPIGSVKSLIGHGLAASGIASIIKAVLIINKGIIPPHIAVQPHELLEASCLYLPSQAERLQNDSSKMNIGVSSFGFGGANSHVVLSSYREADSAGLRAANPFSELHVPANLLKEPIAIMDCGCDRDDEHLYGDSGRLTPFPFQRFQFPAECNAWNSEPVLGDFFADAYTIDASGLKMGPNSLQKIDPFLAIAMHTLNVMLSRNEHLKNTQDTAVVMGNNMSGTMSLRQFRKCYFMFHQDRVKEMRLYDEVKDFLERELSFEEITSTIPAMLSGYPSRSFNIQGFHQTMSGGPSTFLQMLLMAPYWLDIHCSNLVLGVGHIIKSPADLVSYQQGAETLPSLREGIFTFILRKWSDVKGDSREALGYIPAIVPGSHAATFEEACKAVHIDPASVGHIETCQLTPSSFYMGEASGSVELLRLIHSDSKISCLQFVHHKVLTATVFYVKEKNFAVDDYKIQIPTDICFNGPNRVNEKNAANTEPEVSKVNVTTASPVLSFPEASYIHDHMAALVMTYLEHQEKLVQAFSKSSYRDRSESCTYLSIRNVEENFKSMYRNLGNIVVENIHFRPAPTPFCEGELVVDQEHPYFFDHPLDHVPGFLIMEGILQLTKICVMHKYAIPHMDNYYVHALKVSFDRYCELNSPIHIRVMEVEGHLCDEMVMTSEVIQDGSTICSAKIGVRKLQSKLVAGRTMKEDIALANQQYVHKVDKSNIVVEGLEIDPVTETATCTSILPPDEHILMDGGGKTASILYLLEVTRQFLSQISHTFGVPFDMMQILLSMDIRVQEPLDNKSTVSIACEKQKTIRLNDTLLSNLKTTISCGNLIIAETMYKTQAVNQAVYNKLRKKSPK